jgi:hypothetical protein
LCKRIIFSKNFKVFVDFLNNQKVSGKIQNQLNKNKM